MHCSNDHKNSHKSIFLRIWIIMVKCCDLLCSNLEHNISCFFFDFPNKNIFQQFSKFLNFFADAQ